MRDRRRPAFLAVVLLAVPLLAWPAPAESQSPAELTVRPRAGKVGQVFHFSGAGYSANETVKTVVRWPDGTDEADVLFQANAEGVVEFIWDSKGAVPGSYRATATGDQSGHSASVAFTVTPG